MRLIVLNLKGCVDCNTMWIHGNITAIVITGGLDSSLKKIHFAMLQSIILYKKNILYLMHKHHVLVCEA